MAQALAQQGGRRAIVAHMWGMVEGTSSFLGIENCWMNLGAEPELMMAWFDRYADWLCDLVDSLIDAGVDMITLSDDWGSNGRMLFSPGMWRRMIAPYARRVVQHARSRNLLANLHSDGYILDIMYGRPDRHRLHLAAPGSGERRDGPADDQAALRRQDRDLRLA